MIIHNKWKFFNLILLSSLILVLLYFLYSTKNNYIILGNKGNSIEHKVNLLINKLNIKTNNKYKIWIANFNNETIPTPDISDEYVDILWLGSVNSFNPENIDKYDIILASTPILAQNLKRLNVNAYYLPLGNFYNIDIPKDKDPDIWALIGTPLYIEDILIKKNIKYQYYSLNDENKILNDMHRFNVVVATDTEFYKNSFDIHPIFFKMAENNIPIITYWGWPIKNEPINLFNDFINFYIEKHDLEVLIDEIIANKKTIQNQLEQAKNLAINEFGLDFNRKRLKNIIEHKKDTSLDINKYSINVDLGVAVGHIGSGDYWLAKDLLHSLNDKYQKTITYFNSLYKYKSMYNILLRGFIPNSDDTLIGKNNILYIAYPQFAQTDTLELVEDVNDYISNLKKYNNNVDAIIVASEKLNDLLKENGINSYYFPQFTNLNRFYPDYHKELATDILFVGINSFYRKAYKYLLDENIDVTIYGPGYDNGISKGEYLDNRILRKYYSSAKIVLNDTRDGMKKYGFISNRIFDATACGTLVISDYMKEIEDVFGDSVPMWKTKEELVNLVKYYLDPQNEKERIEKANRAREITLNNFTSEIMAKKLQNIIYNIRKDKDEN